jgi:hypothetical protein
MSSRLLSRSIFLAIGLAGLASAQVPFRLLVTQTNSAITVQNGATLTFSGTIGQMVSAKVTATYTGTGQVLIFQAPNVVGSTAFTAPLTGTPPIMLGPNTAVSFTIQFLPTTASLSNAQIALPYSETLPAATSGGSPTTTTGAINLSCTGTAPSFVLSYILQADQNVVPLQSGGTIPFAPTVVGATTQAALNVSNTGSGPGVVSDISIISGTAFRLSGKPLFPFTVAPAGNLQVVVQYQPTVVGSDAGQVQITFDSGTIATINLQGTGTAPSFVYQVQTNPPTVVAPGGTITLPSTNVGQSSSIVVKITNSGTANGLLSSLNITGQGFQLVNPPATNQTLLPGATLAITISFTPTTAGTLTGSLFINSDTLILSGVGLGPQLTFSYVAAGATITLGSGNNSVVFSPTAIGQAAQLSLDVKNTGTLAATISNIGVGQTNSPFSISPIALPVSLSPGADVHITITFTPAAVGFSTGTLQFDTTSVTLVGSGTQPPPLPSYTISGASGTVAPQTQPMIALTLSSAYPVALTGTLILGVSGSLPADPAVQFATGGLTVPFVIPANSTSAVFGKQGTQIGIQTGTVASTITFTPSFATQAGGVDVTPASPATLQVTVAPAAPVLLALTISAQTATSFTLSVTGYTTSRTLTTWTLQLTPATGFSLPATQFPIDVQPVSKVWFLGTASRSFGGQFTISIPFTFQGTVPAGQTLLSSIASVSATMANEIGTSNSIQINAH